MNSPLIPWLCAFSLSTPLLAQGNTLSYQLDGLEAGDHFGHAVDQLADLDGDGFGDFIVTAPFASPGGLAQAGAAYVYSGATGTLLYTFAGEGAGDQFGTAVANIGDTNADGFDDFTVGAPFADINGATDNGATYTYSGATGLLIRRFNGSFNFGHHGQTVSWIGDIDGDGKNEMLSSEPGHTPVIGQQPKGKVVVYRVSHGTRLLDFFSVTVDIYGSGAFGTRVFGTDDINGDGLSEIIAGQDSSVFARNNFNAYRSDDGTYLFPVRVNTKHFAGVTPQMARLGDLDQDGCPDFGIAQHKHAIAGRTNSGIAVIYSGLSLDPLFIFEGGQSFGQLGISITGAKDLDGDGIPDFAFGSGEVESPGGASLIDAYSGTTGALMFQINGSDGFGASLSLVDDHDGDGLDDLLVGSPLASPGANAESGSVYLYH